MSLSHFGDRSVVLRRRSEVHRAAEKIAQEGTPSMRQIYDHLDSNT